MELPHTGYRPSGSPLRRADDAPLTRGRVDRHRVARARDWRRRRGVRARGRAPGAAAAGEGSRAARGLPLVVRTGQRVRVAERQQSAGRPRCLDLEHVVHASGVPDDAAGAGGARRRVRVRGSLSGQCLDRWPRRRRQGTRRLRQLLQRARIVSRGRPPDRRFGRSPRCAAGGGDQPCLLAAAVRRRLRTGEADGAEWHRFHDRRGGPGGLPRHLAGRAGVRRDPADGGLRHGQPPPGGRIAVLLVGAGDGAAGAGRSTRRGAADGRSGRQAHHCPARPQLTAADLPRVSAHRAAGARSRAGMACANR